MLMKIFITHLEHQQVVSQYSRQIPVNRICKHNGRCKFWTVYRSKSMVGHEANISRSNIHLYAIVHPISAHSMNITAQSLSWDKNYRITEFLSQIRDLKNLNKRDVSNWNLYVFLIGFPKYNFSQLVSRDYYSTVILQNERNKMLTLTCMQKYW